MFFTDFGSGSFLIILICLNFIFIFCKIQHILENKSSFDEINIYLNWQKRNTSKVGLKPSL